MTDSLIPDIPDEEKKYFEKFYVMYSKLLVLQNLTRGKISFHKARFERITELLEKGLYNEARHDMADCIMSLQTNKKIDGFGIQVKRI